MYKEDYLRINTQLNVPWSASSWILRQRYNISSL